MIVWIVAVIAASLCLAYVQARSFVWALLIAAALISGAELGVISVQAAWIAGAVVAPCLAVLVFRPLRRALLSAPAMNAFARIMPKMSPTEQAAIDAGTVGWDAELFSGAPQWRRLLDGPTPVLSPEEQRFLDEDAEHLCDLANDWDSTSVWQDLPPEAWAYARERGFLGMIIPKAYGGLGFSAYAHSQVVQKLSTRCSAAAVSVMVPNSLGPAELLLHYGTEAQKDHYLPRLASGEEIPCFALTNPYAGSDAASITDTGVVCRRMWNGRETLGFSITWRKRYITLAPIATVIGLAFRAQDPDGLLGEEADLGITCVLLPRDHPGVNIGRRHWPLNAVFQNGPITGDEVFVPMDMVIGGQEQVGSGWRMLMECLAAGRAISLPSSNVGMSKLAVGMMGAYVAIRRQFNQPLGALEGVQEALGRMAGHLYATDAMRRFAAAAVDDGQKPAVISAIAKYHVTERARVIVNDAMDVAGGKGVCMGPSNFLARAYQQIPIAITVEGANIMTRTLIIYGQGAIRCHPYVLPLMRATEAGDRAAFDRGLFGYIGYMVRNGVRAAVYAVTGGGLIAAPHAAARPLRRYYRAGTRLSILLALASDLSMASLGGALKRRGATTGRLGDMLSELLMLSAILKRYEEEGRPAEDIPLVHWVCRDALSRAETAFDALLANHPSRLAAFVLRVIGAPFGLGLKAPADRLTQEAAGLIQRHGAARDRLLAGSWTPRLEVDPIAATLVAFDIYPEVEALEARLKPAMRDGRIARMPQNLTLMPKWAAEAESAKLIDRREREMIETFAAHADQAVQVDDFPEDFGIAAGVKRREAEVEPRSKRKAA